MTKKNNDSILTERGHINLKNLRSKNLSYSETLQIVDQATCDLNREIEELKEKLETLENKFLALQFLRGSCYMYFGHKV